PLRQGRLEALRAQIARDFPDFGERGDGCLTVSHRTLAPTPVSLRLGQRTLQQPDGVLAVIATDPSEFFQHRTLLLTSRLAVALVNRSQIIPLGLSRHTQFLHFLSLPLLPIMSPRRVRFSNGATNLLSVRLYTAQYVRLTSS